MPHRGDLSLDSVSSAMPVTTNTQGDQKTVLDLMDLNILLAERPDTCYASSVFKKRVDLYAGVVGLWLMNLKMRSQVTTLPHLDFRQLTYYLCVSLAKCHVHKNYL